MKLNFDTCQPFEPFYIRPLAGVIGLYFIALTSLQIPYPFRKTKLIYIGMSEKRTNSISTRLLGHYDGKSGNIGLYNYRATQSLVFTYINFEMLKNIWPYRVEDLESYFILDFVDKYGVYPICNNKTGFEVKAKEVQVGFEIDWMHFEGGGGRE